MSLLLADFIYFRDCKLNLRKTVDTTLQSGLVLNSGEDDGAVTGNRDSAVSSGNKDTVALADSQGFAVALHGSFAVNNHEGTEAGLINGKGLCAVNVSGRYPSVW